MRNVPVSYLSDLIERHNPEMEAQDISREIRLALQGVGYPPEAEEVNGVDAVAILAQLDAGIAQPMRASGTDDLAPRPEGGVGPRPGPPGTRHRDSPDSA